MKHLKFLYLISIVFILISGCSKSIEVPLAYDGLTRNAIFTKEWTSKLSEKGNLFPNNTQLALAYVDGDTAYYYGLIRTNDSLSTIQNFQSTFEIGSITKVFTAHLLAQLVLENKIKLDDEITTHVGVPLNENPIITFEELANHTSGLPRMPSNIGFSQMTNREDPYAAYDEAALLAHLEKALDCDKSQGYSYSNLGAGLLGYLITRIEKQPYEDLLQKRIFSRIGMDNSSTIVDENTIIRGINAAGEYTSNWDLAVLVGAGGIKSNTSDMARFIRSNFDPSNEANELQRKETFLVDEGMSLGLGWHILNRSGHQLFWHNGGTGGYRSSLALNMNNRKGLVVLSNVSAFHEHSGQIDDLVFDLLEKLVPKDSITDPGQI